MRNAVRTLASTVLLATLVLVGPALAQTPESGPLVKGAYTFPETVLELRRISFRDYEPEAPGLGFSVGYRGPILTATVYVYDRRVVDIPEGTESTALAQEFEQSFTELQAAIQQGVYRGGGRYEEQGRGDLPATPIAFRYLTFDLVGDQSRQRSYLFLTGLRGKFLKVRVTAAPNAINVDRETGAFLKALSEQLARGS